MLGERSKQVRRDTLQLSKANGGYHYGGCFSAVEILLSLFDTVLDGNDRFILSKGHACWPYYVLLRERGFNPSLEGHPHLDLANGVHWTTGSEGHGLPAGVGMALARKLQKRSGKVYVLIGDGECQEGTTWESLLMAAQYKLNNLTVIVDFNKTQGSGFTKDILNVDCIARVANDVGWLTHTVDGHNIDEVTSTILMESKLFPHLIVADTVKGKGVSFMEGQPAWHARWPNPEEVAAMLKELA